MKMSVSDHASFSKQPCINAEEKESSSHRSDVAEAVERLKHATVTAAQKRDRLPQPLFWSLFASEIEAIREKKAAKRIVHSLLGDRGWE